MKYCAIIFGGVLLLAPMARVEGTMKPVSAEEISSKQVVVHIEGLSCPLCVFGVKKHLKKVEGVEEVEVSLSRGTALLTIQPGATVDPEAIREAVEKAGFKVSKIEGIE